MNTTEILQSLPNLPISDRLQIAEAALHLVQQEQPLTQQRRQQMAIAALTAISDYSSDKELIAFTVLDGEDFWQQGEAEQEAQKIENRSCFQLSEAIAEHL